MNQTQLVPLITIAAIVVLLGVRVMRMSQEQRFQPSRMWVVPGLFALFTLWLIVTEGFTSPIDWAWMVLALGAGLGIGWYQGTHTTVRVDHTAHAMFVKISPWGGLIWIAVLVVRMAVRYVSTGLSPGAIPADPQSAAAAAGPAGFISMALLVLAVGVIIGLRAYLQQVYARERAAL